MKRNLLLMFAFLLASIGIASAQETITVTGTVVDEAVFQCQSKGISDWGKIKNTIKDSLGEYVWKKTKRRPMILPVIMEV